MNVKVVYEDLKDKELIELIEFSTPFFIDYIDYNTTEGRKKAYKIKSEFGAKKNPFVVIYNDEDKFVKCYWSENNNACQSFVNDYK